MPLSSLRIRFGLGQTGADAAHFSSVTRLRSRYDVVVIGAGLHGLATAYYLVRNQGVKDVAIVDSGGLGQHEFPGAEPIASNLPSRAITSVLQFSMQQFEQLASELDSPFLSPKGGHLSLAHSDRAMRSLRLCAGFHRRLELPTEVVDLPAVRSLVHQLQASPDATRSVRGGVFNSDARLANAHALGCALARSATRLGADLHQFTEVTDLEIDDNNVTGVITNRGPIACDAVVQCLSANSSTLARKAAVKLPIRPLPLQRLVTQRYRGQLKPTVASPDLGVDIVQAQSGEFILTGAPGPWPQRRPGATVAAKKTIAGVAGQLVPVLGQARLIQHWAGLVDQTPDQAPVMGKTTINRFYVNVGWGMANLMAAPFAGHAMAELVASDRTPDAIKPFQLNRFVHLDLIAGANAWSNQPGMP